MHLPRPNCTAGLLHFIEKAEKTLQKAVDDMGEGGRQDSASSYLIGPGNQTWSDDSADPGIPAAEEVGQGAVVTAYKGRRQAVALWKKDLDSSNRIAGNAVDNAALIGPDALTALRETIATLRDQLSIRGKLTQGQEMIMRGQIEMALAKADFAVRRAQFESGRNARWIDNNTPKPAGVSKLDGSGGRPVEVSPPDDSQTVYGDVQTLDRAAVPQAPVPLQNLLGEKVADSTTIRRTPNTGAVRNVDYGTALGNPQSGTAAGQTTSGTTTSAPAPAPASGGQTGTGGGADTMSAFMPLMQAIMSLTQNQQNDGSRRHAATGHETPQPDIGDPVNSLPITA